MSARLRRIIGLGGFIVVAAALAGCGSDGSGSQASAPTTTAMPAAWTEVPGSRLTGAAAFLGPIRTVLEEPAGSGESSP